MSTFRQKVQATTERGKPDPANAAQTSGTRAHQPRGGARLSITSHRLFPVSSALWFAALLGLGSLAISSEVLGTLVTATGLSALVPAAAPPLGFTAHVLVALLLTIVGGVLGFALGLRLHRPVDRPADRAADRAAAPVRRAESAASAQFASDGGVPKVRARDAHPDAPPRRPLVLTEAFAESADFAIPEPAIPEPAVSNLAIPEQAAPLLRRKPLAGGADAIDAAPESWLSVSAPQGAHNSGEEALPPLDLAEAADAYEAPFASPEPIELAAEFPGDAPFNPAPFNPAPAALMPMPVVPAPVVPALLAATPQVPSGFTLALPSREQILAGEPWSPVASAAIDSLGLVQLIERLALAIAARKAANDASPPPKPDSAEADPAEPQVSAGPAPFAMPADPAGFGAGSDEPVGSAREAIMRRLGVVGTQAPIQAPIQAPTPAPTPAPAPFSRPAQTEAVVPLQSPEQLAVPAPDGAVRRFVAPAEGAPASLETDEALRSALATLQRMTARG